MDDDDLEPRKAKKLFAPLKLDGVSDEDLCEYLAHLKAEIERVEAQRQAKGTMRGAAEAAFKS